MKMIIKGVIISGRLTNIIIDSKGYYQGQIAGRNFSVKQQKEKILRLKRELSKLKNDIKQEEARTKDIRNRPIRSYGEYIDELEKEYSAKAESYNGEKL